MIKRLSSRGATIVEYALIGIMVVVISLGAWALAGKNLNWTLQGLKGDMSKNVAAAANAATVGAGGGGGTGLGGAVKPPAPNQTQVCYDSGWCVNVPANSTASGATTGAMGDKQAYAQMIQDLKNQSKAIQDQQLTDILGQLVATLANQGVTTADVQQNSCPPGAKKCVISTANAAAVSGSADAFSNIQQVLQDYLDKHPGKLPPEIQAMINQNAAVIDTTAAQYQAGATVANATGNVTTTLTSSANICTAGLAGACDASLATVDATGATIGGGGTTCTATNPCPTTSTTTPTATSTAPANTANTGTTGTTSTTPPAPTTTSTTTPSPTPSPVTPTPGGTTTCLPSDPFCTG